MAKKSITKEQTVRYETWINPQTGESREFAVVDKPINQIIISTKYG